ncbi:MAG: RNase adapter RapZ [Burkholderiales bacterium]
MDVVLIGGLSGSGKSVALGALEDAGYDAIGNLPVALVVPVVGHLARTGVGRVAIALDARRDEGLAGLGAAIESLKAPGTSVRLVFLDAKDETLVKRFSETRRRHPCSNDERTLTEAIDHERRLLADARALGIVFDTSDLTAGALRAWIKDFVGVDASRLALQFESFGFKHGVPLDADLVFDVRCLPNPHYEPALASQTGRDPDVVAFLQASPEVERMYADIHRFVADWLPGYARDNRNYLTVAIGCTGGRHRSVYLVERLARDFAGRHPVLRRHRELA